MCLRQSRPERFAADLPHSQLQGRFADVGRQAEMRGHIALTAHLFLSLCRIRCLNAHMARVGGGLVGLDGGVLGASPDAALVLPVRSYNEKSDR